MRYYSSQGENILSGRLNKTSREGGVRERLRSGGFTLIELLLVAAVLALMVGLLVPAFNQLGSSQQLSNAGNRVAELIARARQNSMTRNCLTVLVIPTGANQWNSCILYELRPRLDGAAPSSNDWKAISKWETFPEGVTIDGDNLVDESRTSDLTADLPPIVHGETPITQFHFVAFLPRGTLFPKTLPGTAEQNPWLRLVQGSRSGQNVIYTQKNSTANTYKITIIAATGMPKIDRS